MECGQEGSLYLYTTELGTTPPPELSTSRLLYIRFRQNRLRYYIINRTKVHHWLCRKMVLHGKQEYCTSQNKGVLLNFGRTEKMWAVCGGKINILPTSYQYTIHNEPMFCPGPHLLGGVNVEITLIVSQWLIYEWARCGEFCGDTANSAHTIIYLSSVPKMPPIVPYLA